MELPSVLYMQALSERIDYLTSFIKDTPEYKNLTDLGCVFLDGYVLYDPITKTQLEFEHFFINRKEVKDWQRVTAIITQYTTLVAFICNLRSQENCVEKFHQIKDIRYSFYKQLLRERVYHGLEVWWKNMNGYWRIEFTNFEPPWGYYKVYKLEDKTPSEMGRSRLERMHLYLTEYDMWNDTRSLMFCEEIFLKTMRELGILE